jgi:putative phosphoribosyl transferase
MLTIRTILHPTDFSDDSDAAFRFACALARDYGARLVLLHTVPQPLFQIEADIARRPGGPEDEAQARLFQMQPDDRRIEVTHRLVEGPTAETIIDTAAAESCDLIVMGTHGRTGLRRALMGSVAAAVSRRAMCPVVTVRGPAFPGEPGAVEISAEEADLGVGDPAREVAIPVGDHRLAGTLRWPGTPRGVVVFAHGSGSSRLSPRNQSVAEHLARGGFATLLMDLLDEEEAVSRANVFDVDLLAGRLVAAVDWLAAQPETAGLPVGLFGASTGSAAAIVAAARHPGTIAAVVSRGGRPDLADEDLSDLRAPTLLLVGGADETVLELNQQALGRMRCSKELTVIPGATHLFVEPGTLDEVARLALDWFDRHLTLPARASRPQAPRP